MLIVLLDRLKNTLNNRLLGWIPFNRLPYLIFLFSLMLQMYYIQKGLDHTIYDLHTFRQSQTALTVNFIIEEGFKLDYATPLLGYPYSVPFEFPLYQWCVAMVVILFGLSIDIAGRIVGIFFFYIGIIFLYKVLKLFIANSRIALIPISLILLSPVYLFWTRTVMIESTVLALSLIYIYNSIKFIKKPNSWGISLVFIFGVLASLTKVTTYSIFNVPVFFFF